MKVFYKPLKSEWPRLCARPVMDVSELERVISGIFRQVEADGDKALLKYTEQFDKIKLKTLSMPLSVAKKQAAENPKELKAAIDAAYDNIQKFHKVQALGGDSQHVNILPGVDCWRESRPIEKVGIYVPGGSAPLVSTVLMLGVPAQLAGCREIVLCTPPDKNGGVHPAICYAALKTGVTKIVPVGGAQGIAGLAVGTQSVPKVDKIFGPGNQYVTAAKQYAVRYGTAIDMPAGPSEVMVIADKTANPAFVAADLLSQAEHGPDSQAVLVAKSAETVESIKKEVNVQLSKLPRKDIADQALKNSFCVVVDSLEEAMEFANTYAPEHLILNVKAPDKLLALVTNAGSVFVGPYSPESAGDYASGTNHTLPTNGWARSYGGVSLDSFVKKVTFQSLTKKGLADLAPTITRLAAAEQLDAHARAVTIRLDRQ